MKRLLFLLLGTAVLLGGCTGAGPRKTPLRLLYWNIQNGMWDGQDDDYGRFVTWVKQQEPDVCVWCEAQPIYKNGTADKLDDLAEWRKDEPLLAFWKELAARYGHEYISLSGHRDNYPQVVTSRYPIEEVERIIGNGADSVVSHGALWARVQLADKPVNIVTLHTWPASHAFRAKDHEASKAENGGDKYRAMEMKYICEHTIGTVLEAKDQLWMMMGDFNSRSRVDNDKYGYADDDPKFLVHDYIREHTPYIDVIKEKYPDEFKPSTGSKGARIDYVYCTKPLYDRITFADIIWDDYTTPIRDPQNLSNFWRPSDHLPIIVDFDMK
jgi:endonuclease/exonuclease/phosphatase family metal-dependent hydrolase